MELVKLKKLLKDIPNIFVRGSKEIEITGISCNSKLIAPGNLFIAKKGLKFDGAQFIPEAAASGAIAIVTDMYQPFFPHLVQIIAEDVATVEVMLAQEFYNHASRHLFLVGITGTNGKTTTSYLIKHLFDGMGASCGLIGSIESIVGRHTFPSALTTSDVVTNYKLFHEMVEEGCESCVMEVSSHALDQQRVRSIEFDIAIFTNLTPEHLDYHHTMESYAQAKEKLFSSLVPGEKPFSKIALLNKDSPYAQQMQDACSSKVLTYGIETACDLQAKEICLSTKGTRGVLHYQKEAYPFTTHLIGRFNVYNLLAAIGAGIARGFPIVQMLEVLSTFHKVQGRLEPVENARGLHIFVDHAHKEDALANVLKTLKEIYNKKIITVFGCGGNRDSAKRPKMGSIAESFSDVVIITNDNPRSEDPLQIISQVLSGLKQPSRAHIIPDRREAIRLAIALCTPEDIVLIAGKGHETYQIFSNGTVAFDDRQVAQEACLISSSK